MTNKIKYRRIITLNINAVLRQCLLIISRLKIDITKNSCYFPIIVCTTDEDDSKEYYDFRFELFPNGTLIFDKNKHYSDINEFNNIEQITSEVKKKK